MPRTPLASSALVLAALAGACDRPAARPVLGSRGAATGRGPAMVFVATSTRTVIEAACHACEGLRDRLPGSVVSSGGASFRVTGVEADACDPSGVTEVLGVVRLTGDPERDPLDVAVLPAGAPIDLVRYRVDLAPGRAADDAVGAALLRRAREDLAGTGLEPGAGELLVAQAIDVDVSGDGRPERLLSAHVPRSADEGPGYRWSALVVAPDGDLDRAATVWRSEVERLVIDASFDLDGDGARELIYSATYLDGETRGAAALRGHTLDLLASWGCGG